MKALTDERLEELLICAIVDDNESEIRRLGEIMDTRGRLRDAEPVSIVAAALYYADLGLHVFPIQPRGKRPLPGTHGLLEATSDEAQIRRWWTDHPDANLAIATGHLVDVVDIDGPIGVESLARELLDEHGGLEDLPVLGKVSTPRAGGQHLYVPAAPGRRNRAALLPGIDTRAAGGYVVAPPSVSEDGKRYVWTQPLNLSEPNQRTEP